MYAIRSYYETFKKAYTGLFGHYIYNRAIEVESIRLLAGGGDYPEPPIAFPSQYYAPNAYTYQKSLHRGKWLDTPVYRIDELDEGARIQGPALILNDTSTTCVDPGWQALVNQTVITSYSIHYTKLYDELGANVVFKDCYDQPENQLAAAVELVEQKVDAMVIIAVDAVAAAPIVTICKEAHRNNFV